MVYLKSIVFKEQHGVMLFTHVRGHSEDGGSIRLRNRDDSSKGLLSQWEPYFNVNVRARWKQSFCLLCMWVRPHRQGGLEIRGHLLLILRMIVNAFVEECSTGTGYYWQTTYQVREMYPCYLACPKVKDTWALSPLALMRSYILKSQWSFFSPPLS